MSCDDVEETGRNLKVFMKNHKHANYGTVTLASEIQKCDNYFQRRSCTDDNGFPQIILHIFRRSSTPLQMMCSSCVGVRVVTAPSPGRSPSPAFA
jgi:hypothetical protein